MHWVWVLINQAGVSPIAEPIGSTGRSKSNRTVPRAAHHDFMNWSRELAARGPRDGSFAV